MRKYQVNKIEWKDGLPIEVPVATIEARNSTEAARMVCTPEFVAQFGRNTRIHHKPKDARWAPPRSSRQ